LPFTVAPLSVALGLSIASPGSSFTVVEKFVVGAGFILGTASPCGALGLYPLLSVSLASGAGRSSAEPTLPFFGVGAVVVDPIGVIAEPTFPFTVVCPPLPVEPIGVIADPIFPGVVVCPPLVVPTGVIAEPIFPGVVAGVVLVVPTGVIAGAAVPCG
jgi:hypothetical protein